MAFSRGKYGVEYHRPVDREAHRLRWILPTLAVLVLASLLLARYRRPKPVRPPPSLTGETVRVTPPDPKPSASVEPVAPRTEAVSSVPVSRAKPPKPAKPQALPPFAAKVDKWIASREWPRNDLELLTLLRDAERQGNADGARGAIKDLMYRATVEDLKDQLVRRLGDLNTRFLFSGTNTPWTATVEVKRGDNLQRMASVHKTTVEALLRLNPQLADPNKLVIGQKLRVLSFPDADLVIHKQLQFAELSLKKRIFKRYYAEVQPSAEPGAYPVENSAGSRASDRLKMLFRQIAPTDREELKMFLAPGSRITVTAQ